MKNYVTCYYVALLFLCSKVSAQVNLSLANRQFEDGKEVLDTAGTTVYAAHMTTKGHKKEKSIIEEVVDGWDAIFEKDRPKVIYNAFDIHKDTVLYKSKPVEVQDDFNQQFKKTVDVATVKALDPNDCIICPSAAKIFRDTQQMTVKFENGQFVPIAAKKDSFEKVGKAIVENAFKMDVIEDSEISDFFKSNSFVYNGEVYHRISPEELESADYKKPRIRKQKPKPTFSDNATFHHSPTPTSNEDFIDDYDEAALDGERYGVPYAITMAQGILESRGGRSKMAVQINNLFGIKDRGGRCNKDNCPHGYYDDDRKDETFVRYSSYEASFRAHIKFFLDNERYNKCLSCGIGDIGCWLLRLQQSGYATDRTYDYKLAEIINRYKLAPKPIRYNRKEVANRFK